MLKGRRVLVGITGGIAAYKLCEVVSSLAKMGVEVRVVLTEAAQIFVSSLTFSTLSRQPAYTDHDFWQPVHGRPLHIELGEWAEIIVLAPLTANTIAKLAHGLADNLLTNVVLASSCPVLLIPAMNNVMWQQRSVQRNWQLIQADDRFHSLDPLPGILACTRLDEDIPPGAGRMAEPPAILAYITSLLYANGYRDLAGKRLLISAGGTQEYLDPIRFMGNPSTGKMGLALAQAALHRGAMVTLVHGPLPVSVETMLPGVPAMGVTTAAEMRSALLDQFSQVDWMIMAAAVADVKPASYSPEKLPKRSLPSELPLAPVPDILMELSSLKQSHQVLIGFAAQTGDIIPLAEDKLQRKQLDAIVANPIDQPHAGFGSENNQGVFIDRTGRKVKIAPCSKLDMAHQIMDLIHTLALETSVDS